MKHLFSFVLLFLIVPTAAPARLADTRAVSQAADASALPDLAKIRNRYALSVLPSDAPGIEYLHEQGATYAASERADGSWPDINYGDSPQPFWPATNHLQRLLVMSKSARLFRNAGHSDAALEKKIQLAFHWWTMHDYQDHLNPALWWWNEIGVPELIGESANLMWAQLPKDEIAGVAEIMTRADWQRGPIGRSIGANLIWKVSSEIVRGCLQNDPAPVAEGYNRMYQEVRIVGPNDAGIQQDFSFHQHGNQIYSGGYGLDFADDVGRFVSFAWGTRFQIPPDRMAIFSSYLLDGEQWLIRGNIIDYSTVGREIAREGKVAVPRIHPTGPISGATSPVGAAYSIGNVVAMLAAEPTPRQKEFQAFSARLQEEPGAPAFTGNKQFWCSDFMAHRRKAFYTSVKMMSTRIRNGELVNSEGKKSAHLSDGVNYLYLTGDEYKDIFPVWDWTKLPGITAIQGTLNTGEKDPINELGTTTFDGGVSDGIYGMAAMDLARGELTASKAWFFFDSSYVALGAGITLTDDRVHPVATDVNQTLLSGTVLTSWSHGPLATGLRTYDAGGPVWVYHDHVGYVFPRGARLSLSAGPQSGRWTDLGFGRSDLVTKQVFDLWIDHGHSPRNASYEYIVLPGATPKQVAQRAANTGLLVLSNTGDMQAVYSERLKLVEAAFRKAGTLATPLGPVEVDHSCLLMVSPAAGGGWKVSASNPENQPLTLHVSLKGKSFTMELPMGEMAGSTKTAVYR